MKTWSVPQTKDTNGKKKQGREKLENWGGKRLRWKKLLVESRGFTSRVPGENVPGGRKMHGEGELKGGGEKKRGEERDRPNVRGVDVHEFRHG